MKKLILSVICIVCISCASFKEKQSIAFFNQWRNDTEIFLSENKPETELKKEINEILTFSECSIDYTEEKKNIKNSN